MLGNFLLMWPQRVFKRGSNPKPAQSLVVHQKKSSVLALHQKRKQKKNTKKRFNERLVPKSTWEGGGGSAAHQAEELNG